MKIGIFCIGVLFLDWKLSCTPERLLEKQDPKLGEYELQVEKLQKGGISSGLFKLHVKQCFIKTGSISPPALIKTIELHIKKKTQKKGSISPVLTRDQSHLKNAFQTHQKMIRKRNFPRTLQIACQKNTSEKRAACSPAPIKKTELHVNIKKKGSISPCFESQINPISKMNFNPT